MHEVLVNRLGGLSLPKKSVVRLTDRPDMTLGVYRGRKTIQQQQQSQHSSLFINNLRGGATYPLGPPNNPPTCTGKTIPLNSILEFSIISYFKMRNVIIWHLFIKNLVGTRHRYDVDATSLHRIDVVTSHRRRYDVMCLLGVSPPPPQILNLAPPPKF